MCKKLLGSCCLLICIAFFSSLKSYVAWLDVLQDPQTGCLVYLYGDEHGLGPTKDLAAWEKIETTQENYFNTTLDCIEKDPTAGKMHILIEGDPTYLPDKKYDREGYTVIRKIFDKRFDLKNIKITNIENRPISFFWVITRVFNQYRCPFLLWDETLSLSDIEPSALRMITLQNVYDDLETLKNTILQDVYSIKDEKKRNTLLSFSHQFEEKYSALKAHIHTKVPLMETDACLIDSAIRMSFKSFVDFIAIYDQELSQTFKDRYGRLFQSYSYLPDYYKKLALSAVADVINKCPMAKKSELYGKVRMYDRHSERSTIASLLVGAFSALMDLNILNQIVSSSIQYKKVVLLAGATHTNAVKEMLLHSGYCVKKSFYPDNNQLKEVPPLSSGPISLLMDNQLLTQWAYRHWFSVVKNWILNVWAKPAVSIGTSAACLVGFYLLKHRNIGELFNSYSKEDNLVMQSDSSTQCPIADRSIFPWSGSSVLNVSKISAA